MPTSAPPPIPNENDNDNYNNTTANYPPMLLGAVPLLPPPYEFMQQM